MYRLKRIVAAATFLTCIFDAAATIRIVLPAQSVQDAINASQTGDTLILEDGEYLENLVVNGIGLTIASRYLLDGNSAHIQGTIVNGGNGTGDTLSCLLIDNTDGLATMVVGLTFSDGHGTPTALVENQIAGGAIFSLSDLSIDHCVIRKSTAMYGGGLFIQGESTSEPYELSMTSCIVESCFTSAYAGAGWIKNCNMFARSLSILSNSASIGEGAFYIDRGIQDISDCRFENNSGPIGGLSISRGEGTVQNSTFVGNGGVDGLACHLYCSGGRRLKVNSCQFMNSQSGSIAVFLYGRTNDSIPDFYGNIISANNSFDLTGTIAMITGFGRIHHNVIVGNQNVNGGALYVADGAFLRADHNVFESNTSDNPASGSVLLMNGNNTVVLDSNIIMGNGGVSMSCVIVNNCQNTVFADNNWWGDETGPYHPTLNPNGQGDTLEWNRVDFTPWLTSPPDTSLPNDVSSVRPVIPSTWRLLSLYPNPFNNEFRIEIAGFTRDDFVLSLYDLLGREVAVLHRGGMVGGSISFTAPPDLSSGVYFVKAADRHSIETKKVVLLK